MRILANDGIDPIGKQILEAAGFEVDTVHIPQEELATRLNNYDAVTVRSATKLRQELIDLCPNIKVIGRGGVGMDNIDVDYARSKGITVVNTPAASSHSVAELVFAHLLNGVRFLYDSNRQMPVAGATKFGALKKAYGAGSELQGKTLGVVGFGRIGRETAKIGLGLGMNVIYSDLFEGPMSRGGVVDELALVDALNTGKVAFAGLDVYDDEPTPRVEILTHPKISLTPHIGAATNEAQERIGEELATLLIENLKK